MKKITALLLMVILLITGCSSTEEPVGGEVRLVVSDHFGNQILLDKVQDYEAISALELLQKNVKIETAYGGSFVKAIEQKESGYTEKKDKETTDWFYYINGFLSPIGSAEYDLKPGDVVQWDFHDWSSPYVSSIIGAFPKDFIKGYGDSQNNLQMMIEPEFSEYEEELGAYFKSLGMEEINILQGIQEIKNDDNHTIIIGLWKDVVGNSFVNRMVEEGQRTGVFFDMEDKIQLMDKDQKVFFESHQGSIITSFIKDVGHMTKLYLITGKDPESIHAALDVLLHDTEKIENAFSVYVDHEKNMINFPQ